MRVNLFAVIISLFSIVVVNGCVSAHLGDEIWTFDETQLPIGVKAEIEVIEFTGCHFETHTDYSQQRSYCTLWADGRFRIKKKSFSVPKKVSFGLFPGTFAPVYQINSAEMTPVNPVEHIIVSCLASCFVAPEIDAVLIQPFSDLTHARNESLAMASVFGFLKYWAFDDMRTVETMEEVVSKIQIDSFGVNIHTSDGVSSFQISRPGDAGISIGVGNNATRSSTRQRIKAEIVHVGKMSGNISEFLEEYKGAMFEIEY